MTDENNKVKIIYRPIEEIVIGEYIFVKDIEELARPLGLAAACGQPMGLQWAEGVVFIFLPMGIVTDTGQQEYIENGRIHIPSIPFAMLEKYEKTIKTHEGMIVPVIDASESENMRELALWLKSCIVEVDDDGEVDDV